MTATEPRLLATLYRGVSMTPTLRDGDVLLWRRNEGLPPVHTGDVVGFFEDRRFIAHRVVRMDPGGAMATTRGDARLTADPPVLVNHIAYVAVAALRDGRPISLDPSSSSVRLSSALLREARRAAGALRRGARRLASLRPPPA